MIIGEAGSNRLILELQNVDAAKSFLLNALKSNEHENKNENDASNCSYCFSLHRKYDENLYRQITPDGFCFFRLINHFIRILDTTVKTPLSDFVFKNISDRNSFINNWKLLLSYYNGEETTLGLFTDKEVPYCFDKGDPLFKEFIDSVQKMIMVVENFYIGKNSKKKNVTLAEKFWGHAAYVRFIPKNLCAATVFFPKQSYSQNVKNLITNKNNEKWATLLLTNILSDEIESKYTVEGENCNYCYRNTTYGYTISQLQEICLYANCFGIYDREHFYTMPCDNRENESGNLLNAFKDWKRKLVILIKILKKKDLDFYLIPDDYPFSEEQYKYLKYTIYGETSTFMSKKTESSEEMNPEVTAATASTISDENSNNYTSININNELICNKNNSNNNSSKNKNNDTGKYDWSHIVGRQGNKQNFIEKC